MMMHSNSNTIPRWLVENDPSWERSLDSDPGILSWTKKGTNVRAVCHQASMFCQILGETDEGSNFQDLLNRSNAGKHAKSLSGIDDITRYLSSIYLNPGINGFQRFDLRKIPKWQ